MKEFLKLKTDPYDIIRLFPDLLPQTSTIQEVLESSENLTDKEREDGIQALIEYLMEIRTRNLPKAQVNCLTFIDNFCICHLFS